MTTKTNILLVDDHAIVREGLSSLIEQQQGFLVSAQADSVQAALVLLQQQIFDIAIVDLSLDKQNGLDLVKEMSRAYPATRVLVFSMHPEEIYAERALRAGAKGYLMKSEPPEILLVAIKKLLDGTVYLSDSMTKLLLGNAMGSAKQRSASSFGVQALSDRELEIFTLVGKGHPSKEIALQLGLSVKTVDAVRQNIKNKLGFQCASELVKFAIEYANAL
ncbi:response regulator transcription factor [Shewanella avicenniae]|uniref:Response regulator transcription factor n=1 Tax=Shewanella avicenniae TaxID=2814294 RepID=A0ABX7QTG5_9GAMM|nr:response regulator transcription factor [Shewanella avicenniae]QSX34211.1 response regulator transcription factor [Shewanella avicenniae]